MTIDRSGKWWTGSGPEDIEAFLVEFEPGDYRPDRFVHARWGCGGYLHALV